MASRRHDQGSSFSNPPANLRSPSPALRHTPRQPPGKGHFPAGVPRRSCEPARPPPPLLVRQPHHSLSPAPAAPPAPADAPQGGEPSEGDDGACGQGDQNHQVPDLNDDLNEGGGQNYQVPDLNEDLNEEAS